MAIRSGTVLFLALLSLEAGAQDGTVVFVDEFEGSTLGDAWEVLDPDPERLRLEGGALVVLPRPEGARPEDRRQKFFVNRLRWKGALPAAFEMTLEFEHLPRDYQWVRVDLAEGLDHGVRAWTNFSNHRNHVAFQKRIRGRENQLLTPSKPAPEGRRVETILIRREGRAWTCTQQIGGQEWSLVHRIVRMEIADLTFCTFIYGDKTSEEPVRFLRFEVRDLASK